VRDGMLGSLVDPGDRAQLTRTVRAALRQPRGVVPEGLAYFAYGNFEARAHALIAEVLAGSNHPYGQ
jgi:hypothetical protein